MAGFFNFERRIITDKSENFDSNWNSDALPDLFESLSQPKVKLLNPKRYKEMAHLSAIFGSFYPTMLPKKIYS